MDTFYEVRDVYVMLIATRKLAELFSRLVYTVLGVQTHNAPCTLLLCLFGFELSSSKLLARYHSYCASRCTGVLREFSTAYQLFVSFSVYCSSCFLLSGHFLMIMLFVFLLQSLRQEKKNRNIDTSSQTNCWIYFCASIFANDTAFYIPVFALLLR